MLKLKVCATVSDPNMFDKCYVLCYERKFLRVENAVFQLEKSGKTSLKKW